MKASLLYQDPDTNPIGNLESYYEFVNFFCWCIDAQVIYSTKQTAVTLSVEGDTKIPNNEETTLKLNATVEPETASRKGT